MTKIYHATNRDCLMQRIASLNPGDSVCIPASAISQQDALSVSCRFSCWPALEGDHFTFQALRRR